MRKPRADSVRNRERLLAAAREVFSAGGPDASLDAVARTAEVGIGTLYRHFPTREALFIAVYQREVDELGTLAERLSKSTPPVEALRQWLRAGVRMIATKKGMVAALEPTVDSSAAVYVDTATRVREALAGLVRRAVDAGELRGDVSSEEILRVMIGLCYTREQPDWQESVVRLIDIFVDGLTRRGEDR
ncbi:TetR/AcrR family transcriptional regulator [Acuticoccus mangrovi]|uniref:TetR/AcrR family transcriptional regulator n=1 Tax=Acuticoccus mangrovi TaxID=2796142 RepID=A0A934IUR2_9HYPH|nr:TetR/AcrR family transcriptional regulator [Acuticoccus mangrovi]MBJ3778395.1 TetR/AcrR family transcriptional regulator [Acuticoccus mangrovi]